MLDKKKQTLMKQLLAKGIHTEEIARLVGCAAHTVSKYADKIFVIPPVDPIAEAIEKEESLKRGVVQMLRDGCSQTFISRVTGFSLQEIERISKEED